VTLVDRDAYILGFFNAIPLTGRQQVVEVVRVAGFAKIALPGMDRVLLEQDVAGLQTAVAAMANPGPRATMLAQLPQAQRSGQLPLYPPSPTITPGSGWLQLWPTLAADATPTMYQLRVLNAGG
jgi:hypothetical protein